LAYGSLIDNPGYEIEIHEVERIKCVTPFKVEFSRLSSVRGGAPTLIPVSDGGNCVSAQIILLANDVSIDEAKSILYRRELNKVNSKDIYVHKTKPGKNTVEENTLNDFCNVESVLYTSIACNITETITPEFLASNAIKSILTSAGEEKRDGIRYLRNAKKIGIMTLLTPDYEKQILLMTGMSTLDEAIQKLDLQRHELSS
jgi:hypothetical protein